MKTFEVIIEEVRAVRVTYIVSADNIEEARSHDHVYQHGEEVDSEFVETVDVTVLEAKEVE